MATATDQVNEQLLNNAVIEMARLHGEILSQARISLDKAVQIGEILSRVKDTLKHGKFLPWLDKNVPFSKRTAQNYLFVFDHRLELKNANVAYLADAYSLMLAKTNGESDRPAELHEPNFHSQAVRLRQHLIGLFNHYLQRRPLPRWNTEEIYDLLCSLKPLAEICTQLEFELNTRNDAPSTYRQAHSN